MVQTQLKSNICKWCNTRIFYRDSEASSYYGTVVVVCGTPPRAHSFPRQGEVEVDLNEIQIGLRAA
jgi:hypothetical protein